MLIPESKNVIFLWGVGRYAYLFLFWIQGLLGNEDSMSKYPVPRSYHESYVTYRIYILHFSIVIQGVPRPTVQVFVVDSIPAYLRLDKLSDIQRDFLKSRKLKMEFSMDSCHFNSNRLKWMIIEILLTDLKKSNKLDLKSPLYTKQVFQELSI